MRKKKFILIAMSILLVSTGIKGAQAEITLTDWLSVTGFFRYEVAVHTGWKIPHNYLQTDNNDLNFHRQYFQTEWTVKPSDCFQLIAKIRVRGDEAQSIDSDLGSYKAFPVDVPKYDWTMLKMGDTNEFRAEVNELYADLTFGDLWVRMGKQQIVWGEMIATRILDIINPLDYSWNFQFEPEEFDNIRIATWSIRGRYQFGKVGSIYDFFLEGFVNPGDILPNQFADFGSPLYSATDPMKTVFYDDPTVRITDRVPRGEGHTEFGFRTGGMVRGLYFTLNYMRLYDDGYFLLYKGLRFLPGPPFVNVLFDLRYPLTNVFGVTGNYFIAPLNTVATFESTWTPDQPYYDARTFGIKDQGTWKYALRLDRSTFVFPRPTSAMMITLQFSQTVREGNAHNLFGVDAHSRVHTTDQWMTCMLDQWFHHNDFRVVLLNVYSFSQGKHGEYFKPQFTYYYGDHWIFDLYTVYCAGSDKRATYFGTMGWVNETVARITYQF